MATFCDLPEEVLHIIFEHVDNHHLLQYQRVCRSWYLPTHKLLLKTIHLTTANQVDKFINSIDNNPDPRYLASVKQIHITISKEKPWPSQLLSIENSVSFSKNDFRKLFCRFPNLETVEDRSSVTMYSELNDDVGEDLLRSCPKLHTFKVLGHRDDYDHLLKLRLVVTDMELTPIFEITHESSLARHVASFSRLKSLKLKSRHLSTFEQFLPIFERLNDLTKLAVCAVQPDRNDFAEQYLIGKTKDEQELLLKRLSKVKDLKWCNEQNFCVNGLKFITKYLTGLKRLLMDGKLTNNRVNTQQHRLFCSTMLELFSSIDDCKITVDIGLEDLIEYFPLILHNIHQQAAKTGEKSGLKLVVISDWNVEDTSKSTLETIRTPANHSVSIKVRGKRGLNYLMNTIPPETPIIADMDYLEYYPEYNEDWDHTVYEQVLPWLKSLKYMSLQISPRFEDRGLHCTYDQEYDGKVYPLIEEMTITDYGVKPYQSLLNRFAFAFPNIKQLNMRYQPGYWKQHLGEFQLELCKYSLKRLHVDVTKIKSYMSRYLHKECTTDEDFFLLEIEALQTDKRYSYKVMLYRLSTTKIDGYGVPGFLRVKDYFRLHITVDSLEEIELYINSCNSSTYYTNSGNTHITCVIALE